MRTVLTLLTLSAAIAVFVNCSPKTTGAITNSTQTETIESYSDEQKVAGKAIWLANCEKCHKLYATTSYSLNQWKNILPKMTKRAKLDEAQALAVRAYIYTNTGG